MTTTQNVTENVEQIVKACNALAYSTRKRGTSTKRYARYVRASAVLRARAERLDPSLRPTTREEWIPRAKRWTVEQRRRKAGWETLACKIGRAYHLHVHSLAASSEATCTYGTGGQDDESRDSYSKSWHRSYGPRRWKNYGATTDTRTVTLWSHLAHKVATISLARLPRDWRGRVEQSCLLDGDVLGLRETRVVVRYGIDLRRTGVSVPIPTALAARFGKWEHGVTYAACRAEIMRKCVMVEAEQAREHETHKQARRVHLVTIMCPRLQVTYQHARSAGLCDGGIRAYCVRHGLSVETGAPAAIVRATGDDRALRAIEVAAQEAIAARVQHA